MLESLFASDFYKALPGLIVGLSLGIMAIIFSFLPVGSGSDQNLRILAILSLIISIAVIVFGAIVVMYGPPPISFFYNCLLSGAIGIVMSVVIFYFS